MDNTKNRTLDPKLYGQEINSAPRLGGLPSETYHGNAADFGSSKYDNSTIPNELLDNGDYNYLRGEQQNGLAQLGLGALRAIGKAGVEAAKTPGYLFALGQWGMTEDTLDKALDNVWLQGLETLDSKIKETLPVYQSYKSGKGGLWDNIMSTSFWASDGADGVGYLLGLMAPGAALKGLGLANKFAKLGAGAEGLLSAKNLELGVSTMLNSSLESLAEAKGVADRLKKEGASDEQIADAARNTFIKNMGLLIVPDMIMNKNLLNMGNKASKLDDFLDPVTGKVLTSKELKKQWFKDYTKNILGSGFSEGIVEEGGQNTIENYEVNKALGKDTSFMDELANTFTTLEGQKSIFLGSVLGGFGAIKGTWDERSAKGKELPKVTEMINRNFTGFSKDIDIWDKDKDGNITGINPKKRDEYYKNLAAEIQESHIGEIANNTGNELLGNYIENNQFVRWVGSFTNKGELGLEALKHNLDKVAKENEYVAKNKNELVQKAKQLFDIHESITSTIEDLDSVKPLAKSNPILYQNFVNKLTNAAYQEVGKQTFFKSTIKDLTQQINELGFSTTADLPQTKLQIDKLQSKINTLQNSLEDSIKRYQGIFSTSDVAETFKMFEQSEKKAEDNATKTPDEQPPVDNTKENTGKPADQVKNTNSDFLTALNTNSLDEFTNLRDKLNTTLSEGDVKALTRTYNRLIKNINLFAEAIKNGNTTQLSDQEKEFYENNKTHIEKRLKELHDADLAKQGLSFSELGVTPIDEESTEDTFTDNELVSETNMYGSNIDNEDDSSELFSDNFTKERNINTTVNDIMMHLFHHFYQRIVGTKKYIFRLIRDNNGFPVRDNDSNINDDILNTIQKGDTVTLKLTPLTEEGKILNKSNIQNSIENGVNKDDFDGESIGIYHNDELIGFVREPHALSPDIKDPVKGEKLRQDLIKYRKQVISKLKSGEVVTETIESKGYGALYSKFTKDGKVDANKLDGSPNEVFGISREKDMFAGQHVFVVMDKNKRLKVPNIDIEQNEKLQLAKIVGNISIKGKPGQVFKLVKALNNEWAVIPVYANNITDDMSKDIFNILKSQNDATDPKEIIKELNPYIYASMSKKGAYILIKHDDGELVYTIAGKKYNLKDLNSSREEILKALKSAKQNIDIDIINNVENQSGLEERKTLITNVHQFKGEYFVQPFVTYTQTNGIETKTVASLTTKPASVKETIEAQKADIERRRQEELETTKNIDEDKLKEGRENTKKLVESLKQRYPATSVQGIIIRILEKLIDFSKYSTIIDSDYLNGKNASGQATWFGMIISQETFDGILAGKEFEVHTFIHEFIHGFTTSKISDYNIEKQGLIPGFKSKLTAKEKHAIEQLQRIFEKVKKDNPKSKEYGFTNLDEFIAEAFSNTSFQYTLKNTKAEGKKSNLFSEFLEAIGDLLFEQLERWAKRFNKEIPERSTITGILEDVLAWTEDLIDQNNKLAYIATNEEINAKYDAELAALEGKPKQKPVDNDLFKGIDPDKFVEGDEAVSSKSIDITTLDKNKFDKWLKKRIPQISVDYSTQLWELSNTLTDAFGAFKDRTIYLFNGAGVLTGYHEAFHGVFRNLLTNKQRLDLINEAKSKYPAPTDNELKELQDGLEHIYNRQQLEYLYYEEKLANDFANYVYLRTDTNFFKRLGQKIIDLFNKIVKFFNIFSEHNTSSIEDTFDSINKGKLANLSVSNNSVVDLPIYNEFAYSKALNSKLKGVVAKAKYTSYIGNEFIAIYQQKLLSGESNIKATEIYREIYNKYVDLYKSLDDNKDLVTKTKLARLLLNYEELVNTEVKKYLNYRKIAYNKNFSLSAESAESNNNITNVIDSSDNINVLPEINPDNNENRNDTYDEDSELSSQGKETKGFNEATSMSGLSSASTRLKMFLSAIPIVYEEEVNGKKIKKAKLNEFGMPEYHDFSKLYYYIELNLVNKYSFEEKIDALQKLSIFRPELLQVIDKLQNKPSDYSDEQFEIIRNDFNVNFTKQQLNYKLVKFDNDPSTGKITGEIINSNRNELKYFYREQWLGNLNNPGIRTVAQHEGENVKLQGTEDAIKLYKRWYSNGWDKVGKQIKGETLNSIFNFLGIELSEDTLLYFLQNLDGNWRNSLNNIIEYHAATRGRESAIKIDNDTTKTLPDGATLDKIYRESLYDIINYEMVNGIVRHTASFINGENENIYSIQLPSWLSKLEVNLKDKAKAGSLISRFQKDVYYQYNNILNEAKKPEFRELFKIDYLDSLKDSAGKREGITFTNLQPSDYLATKIILYQNKGINDNIQKGEQQRIYTTLIPSDKKMCPLITSKSYKTALASKNNIDIRNSRILEQFYNVFLREAFRINKNYAIVKDIISNKGDGKYNLMQLMQYYHASKDNFSKLSEYAKKDYDDLTKEDWAKIEDLFDGFAFQFNILPAQYKDFVKNPQLMDVIKNSSPEELRANIENLKFNINNVDVGGKAFVVTQIANVIQTGFQEQRSELKRLGIITEENGLYKSNVINVNERTIEVVDGTNVLKNTTPQHISDQINEFVLNFYANQLLFNIDFSDLTNGDYAFYKAKDLQKRAYQGQSMLAYPSFTDPNIATIVWKDYKESTDEKVLTDMSKAMKLLGFSEDVIENTINPFKDNNITDAQVYVTPEFYKEIHEKRGNWDDDMQLAYDIAELKIDPKDIPFEKRQLAFRKLAALKPFYNGFRYDEDLQTMVYEQVKCSMLPLFKSITDINPLLADKRKQLEVNNCKMGAYESSFKAALGFRSDVFDNENAQKVILDSSNFGIQVENPDHMDEGNDSIRQFKMLLLGAIDPEKQYNGKNGSDIIKNISRLEAKAISKSLKTLRTKLGFKNNTDFAEYIKELVTKRNATLVLEEALVVENGDFKNALDQGTISTLVENMVSAIFTNKALKQTFNTGGSAVQASSLGFTYKNLKEQQENLTTEALTLQKRLDWIEVDKDGKKIIRAKCMMPSWSKKFLKKGNLVNINDIPLELRELITYRIPTEGPHSMLLIEVVDFLPESIGNFMLLPYEITTQFGSDFDFDKTYFFGKDFYIDENGEYKTFKLNEEDSVKATQHRYYEYSQVTPYNKRLTYDDFNELPIEDQLTHEAITNAIISDYNDVLGDVNMLPHVIAASGFERMVAFKDAQPALKDINKESFFSPVTQDSLKIRNHSGIGGKGQAALHVTGHSYSRLMGINTTHTNDNGDIDDTRAVNFNGKHETDFSKLYTSKGKLIGDEVSMLLAAVLDDIKNPILEALGIDNNTIDILATIMRAGFDIETALSFTMQRTIKELSMLLTKNNARIKSPNQIYYDVDMLIDQKRDIIRRIITDNKLEDNPALTDALKYIGDGEKRGFYRDNINQKELISHLNDYSFKRDELLYKGDRTTPEQQIYYYIMDARILNQYRILDSIAKDLVDINKFFAINKEVGPNVENIISKQALLDTIEDNEIVNGFDIEKIPTLKASWDVHLEALSFFERYMPYSTSTYMSIKNRYNVYQTYKTLDKLPVEDRIYINNFTRAFTDYAFNQFSNLSDEKEFKRLFFGLPKLLKSIKNPKNGNNTFLKDGKYTYKDIKLNPFIEQLQVTSLKKNRVITPIQTFGNRLDLQVKNNVIEGLKALYNNSETRGLAEDIIKYNFIATGFFKGIKSYSNLISPEITDLMGYNDYRKNIVLQLRKKSLYLSNEQSKRLIDQMVRNNLSKLLYSKKFDPIMFGLSDTEKLPKIVTATEETIKRGNRSTQLVWGKKDDLKFAHYIGIYDKVAKNLNYYRLKEDWVWEQINPLGIPGVFMEIDINSDLSLSKISKNNTIKHDAEDNVEEENDSQPMLEPPTPETYQASNKKVENSSKEGSSNSEPSIPENVQNWRKINKRIEPEEGTTEQPEKC